MPRVAEDPTCQNTLHGEALFSSRTLAPEPNVRVEEGALKIQTADGSPAAFRVSTPPLAIDMLDGAV